MGSDDGDVGGRAMTVASLRETILTISVRLRWLGRLSGAGALDSAAAVVSSPQDELLAMREALVLTAPDWQSGDGDLSAVGRRALAEAKRLAIRF